MDIFASLTHEWSVLTGMPGTRCRYGRWQVNETCFRQWPTVEELIAFAQRRGDPSASDQALALLARWSPSDDLAARALLQALLPGLRAIVVKHYWLTDDEDLAASTIALAWERIRTYPYANRPQRIAANVIRDTAHRLRRTYRDDQRAPSTLDASTLQSEEPAYRTIDVLDLARRNLDEQSLAVVVRTRLRGEDVASVAAELRCTAPALRERRRRAEDKLRCTVEGADGGRRMAS